jgi:metal-responsive CopG/Arc/MetJ family transcriptional regulator
MDNMEKKSKKYYFVLSGDLMDRFEKHINDNMISRPRFIEKLIMQYLDNNDIKKT